MQRFKTTAARKLIENMEGEKDYICDYIRQCLSQQVSCQYWGSMELLCYYKNMSDDSW